MAYSDEEKQNIFDEICLKIINGSSLRSALVNSIDASTFFVWLKEDSAKSKQYAQATEIRAELMFDEILEIANSPIEGVVIETDDNGRTKEKRGDMLGHRRLQIDSRKWMLSKMMPKKYGDKVEDNSEEKEINVVIEIVDPVKDESK